MRQAKVLLSGLFFFGYLAVQLALPASRLWTDYFARFGWTMYAGLGRRPSIKVITLDGSEISLEQIQATRKQGIILRSKVDYRKFVLPYLCEAIPEARLVVLRYPRRQTQETYPCSH